MSTLFIIFLFIAFIFESIVIFTFPNPLNRPIDKKLQSERMDFIQSMVNPEYYAQMKTVEAINNINMNEHYQKLSCNPNIDFKTNIENLKKQGMTKEDLVKEFENNQIIIPDVIRFYLDEVYSTQ